MSTARLAGFMAALFATIALATPAAHAQAPDSVKLDDVKPVFERAIPNIPGKRMVVLLVSYAPGGKSSSHRHAPSAFIYARVLSGAIRSQVNDEPAKVYQVGESWYEEPGAHHKVSENASDREPASLLAVFVVDANDNPITTPDPK